MYKNIYQLQAKRIKPIPLLLIWVTLLIGFCLWSFVPYTINGWASREAFCISTVLFAVVLVNYKKILPSEMNNVAIWTLLSCLFSFIPALIDWNCSPISFLYTFLTTYYGIAFYFILKIYRVPQSQLIKILTAFCIVWVLIEIGQQITYPDYWFLGRRNENETIEQRMGLWRFYIWGVDFVMLLFGYYIGRCLSARQIEVKSIVLGAIFAIGLLCYCSRKHIYCVFAAIGYAILTGKGKHSAKIKFLFIIALLLLIIIYGVAFGEMAQEAKEKQGEGEDFIRFIAANHFLFNFSDSYLYPLFGTGMGSSTLSQHIDDLEYVYGFYRADVGLIGYYSTVGFLGCSAIFYYIYKVWKNWKWIDLGYRMFFIMKIILIIFDFWMMWAIGILAYGVFLYLLDLNISKNKLKLTANENRSSNFLSGC